MTTVTLPAALDILDELLAAEENTVKAAYGRGNLRAAKAREAAAIEAWRALPANVRSFVREAGF